MSLRPGSLIPYDLAPTLFPEPNGNRYALMISRGDIDGQRVERLVTAVAGALSTIDSAERYVGRCMLSIDGYNDDPRDVTQIPEVRSYFQRAAVECPLLPFLLEPVREEMMLYVALVGDGRRLVDESIQHTDPLLAQTRGVMFSDKNKLGTAVLDYAQALGPWLDEHGILDAEDHPLWKAHARSLECLRELEKKAPANGGSGPRVAQLQ